VRADWARYIPTGEYINVEQGNQPPPPTITNSTANHVRQRHQSNVLYNNEPETKPNAPFITLPQITVMLGLMEMFIAGVSFMFAYYSYKIMEEISKGFEFNDNTEDGHKMILYSAFFSYDELINCIISVIAFVAGLTALLGAFSSWMAIIHAMFGILVGGACFLACCVSIFSTLVTLCNGLPVSVVDSMVANFASSVRQVLASKTQPNQVMADITESLVCVIASNCINAITNGILSLLLLSSSVVCFSNRSRLVSKSSGKQRLEDAEVF